MSFYNKHLKLILFFLFALTQSLKAQNGLNTSKTTALSLPELWQKAANQSKVLQMQSLELQKADEQIRDAKTERLPEVGASSTYARVSNMPIYENGIGKAPAYAPVIHNYYQLGGEASLTIYNGNKTNIRIKTEELKKELATEQKNLSVSEIKLKVASLYLDLKRNLVFRKLVNQNIAEQQKRIEQIDELHKHGVVLRSDLLRAQLKLSNEKLSLLQIDNTISLLNQKLDILSGIPDDTSILPTEDEDKLQDDSKSYDEVLQTAFNQSFDLKISEKETILGKQELKEVKSNYLPKLSLFAEYGYTYPQILFYPYADAVYGLGQTGVKLSIPISSLYHNKHKENAAKLEVKKLEVQHSNEEDMLRQEVKENLVRYQESLTRIDVSKENIKQAAENLRIVTNTYFNQLALLTDLLDADTQLLQSKFDLASAQYAARLQYYQLQKTIGNL